MTGVFFVTALVLVLAGALSIASGLPYVRMEFGYTEVIAGSTVLSAGVVTAGLAGLMGKIDRLARAFEAGDGARPTIVEETSEAAAAADLLPPPAAEGAHDGVSEPVLTDPAPEEDARPEPARRRRMPSFFGRRARGGDGADRARPGSDGPASRPVEAIAIGAAGHGEDGAAAVLPGHETAEDVSAQATTPAAITYGEPTVVGRYQAGDSSYVLMSDGSIDVETENGVHHFASMEDLKAFIGH